MGDTMDQKEEFKKFVKSNPKLIKYVKDGSRKWQDFYEIFNLYGDDSKAWDEYYCPTVLYAIWQVIYVPPAPTPIDDDGGRSSTRPSSGGGGGGGAGCSPESAIGGGGSSGGGGGGGGSGASIAISVIVENGGSGGQVAVPIAREVFDTYFN